MKFLVILTLFIVSLCDANTLLCQLFDPKTQYLEKYCENFRGSLPKNCSHNIHLMRPSHVAQLKIGGCANDVVLDAVKMYENVRVLDISHSDYQSLDWLSFKVRQLEKLIASHNELSAISNFTKSTPEITEIDLSYNRLTHITSHTFEKVGKLVRIHLSHNSIQFIGEDAFAALTDLAYINLKRNRLSNIPTFPNSRKLEEVNLEENPISFFNYCNFLRMGLVSVYFSWTKVNSFHGERSSACDLKPLHIVRNNTSEGILVTPNGQYEMHFNANSLEKMDQFTAGRNAFVNVTNILNYLNPNISKIDLSGNVIEKLDINTFRRFAKIKSLDLSDTMLTEFHFGIFKNKNLKRLDVSHNHLKYLNYSELLKDFQFLREFNAAGNQIQNAAELIEYLPRSIEKLDMSDSYVGKLNVTRLIGLRTLKLSNTNLSISNLNPFEQLQNLSELNLSANNLATVNFTVLLSAIRNLKNLNLSHTNIMDFDMSTLQNHTKFQCLDISFNKLRELDLRLLASNHNITHLHINGNDLTKLDSFDHSHFLQMKSLKMSKNQFPCKYLKQVMNHDWKDFKFNDDPLDQKHGIDCPSSVNGIRDFLTSVYDKVKIW